MWTLRRQNNTKVSVLVVGKFSKLESQSRTDEFWTATHQLLYRPHSRNILLAKKGQEAAVLAKPVCRSVTNVGIPSDKECLKLLEKGAVLGFVLHLMSCSSIWAESGFPKMSRRSSNQPCISDHIISCTHSAAKISRKSRLCQIVRPGCRHPPSPDAPRIQLDSRTAPQRIIVG